MRLFWSLIAVLLLSTIAWWMLRSPAVPATPAPLSIGPAPAVAPSPVASKPAEPPAPPVVVTRQPEPAPTPAPAQVSSPAPPPVIPPAKAANDSAAPTPAAPPTPAPQTTPTKTESPKPEASKPPETNDDILDGINASLAEPTGTEPKPAPAPANSTKPAAATPSPAASPAQPEAASPKPAGSLNVKLTPQPDGSTLVDDKYIIKGTGTKEDPYRVTWEMLTSAQDTYQPRLGRKVIPDRLKMIDGKWVRVSGYIAFPVMASSPDEMLMMLNQWDGCCIGVPPTPYDAIEVKLKAAVKGNDRLRTSGTLTGQFKIDPYLVKDWLVSLYVMDSGELSDTAGAATPGQHGK